MKLYNIIVKFPENEFQCSCSVNEESIGNKEIGLLTQFHSVNEDNELSTALMRLLARFYQFGADYFTNGELSGEDVARKLEKELGEIWLENYHFTGVWPHSVNFGELCYSSDESVDIEVTWKYKNCSIGVK